MNNETATLLENHFDLAFAGPKGVQKLRELILTLAMQGKLVPQDPTDRPASELLKDIEADKQRLVKEGKIKEPKPLPEVKLGEVPYLLPKGWKWSRLGDITEIIRGITFPASEKSKEVALGKIACIRTSNVQSEIEWEDLLFIDRNFMKKESQLLCKNDIVMSMANSRELVGKVAIIKRLPYDESTFGGFLGVIRTYQIVPMFVLNLLRTTYARTSFIDSSSQTTNIANVSLGKLNPLLIPIPPIAEQHRIVAKIEQLMTRCDELETLGTDRTQKRTNVHTAAIDRLLTAKADRDFNTAWNFITQHFGELYSVKENVTELRKTILQLAVMGKLVPQDPTDEPASELLKAIELEKQRLVKEGKIKKTKSISDITPDELPYFVPQGWAWVRLGNVISYMDAGWSPQCDEVPAATNEWGVLKTTSVQPLCFLPHENKALPKKLEPRVAAEVKEGDILITRAGPRNRVGICCVVKFVRPHLMLSDKIIRFRIFGDLIFPEYCSLYLYSGHGAVQIEKMKSGMADSQVNISQDKLKQVSISLPPIAEQHRIVAKIDRLMELCDRLDEQIEAAKTKQTELLNALMAEV